MLLIPYKWKKWSLWDSYPVILSVSLATNSEFLITICIIESCRSFIAAFLGFQFGAQAYFVPLRFFNFENHPEFSWAWAFNSICSFFKSLKNVIKFAQKTDQPSSLKLLTNNPAPEFRVPKHVLNHDDIYHES